VDNAVQNRAPLRDSRPRTLTTPSRARPASRRP
jgi:hypothetical protein